MDKIRSQILGEARGAPICVNILKVDLDGWICAKKVHQRDC